MKRITLIAAVVFAFAALSLRAQSSANNLVNTIKERLTISAYGQMGTETNFFDDEMVEDKNTFLVRRIELNLRAKITDKISFWYLADFSKGHTMKDFFVDYNIMPELGFRLGQYKTAYGLENNIAPTINEVITCGAQITRYMVAADPSDVLMGAQGGRDIGIEVHGDLFDRLISYRLGALNGSGVNTLDFNTAKTIDASLIVRPLPNLAIMGSMLTGKAVARNSFILDLITKGTEYDRSRWSVGANFKSKYADFHTEYLTGKDGNIATDGFYFTGSWHIIPKFDLIASYDFFRQNYKLDSQKQDLYNIDNYTVGLQYWFYPKCRIQLQYAYRDVNSINTDPIVLASMRSMHSVSTQLQIAF